MPLYDVFQSFYNHFDRLVLKKKKKSSNNFLYNIFLKNKRFLEKWYYEACELLEDDY